jgi:Ca2+:H+ antiporter
VADLLHWLDPRGGNRLRFLIVFVPIAFVLCLAHAPEPLQFGVALLGLIPLAAVMGEATEHLSDRAGPGIGGLLNATFGNAVELIVALALLFKGKDTVVKASLTGSVLGNLLLVLGASLLAGGWKHRTQTFNRTAAGVGSTMMVLAAVGMLMPALFHALPEVVALDDARALGIENGLSLGVSVALMATYLLSLLFSLRTHKNLYNPPEEAPSDEVAHAAPAAGRSEIWSLRRSILVLIGVTVLVSILGEILAETLDDFGRHLGLTELFLGVVVIAIVGNAAEHSSAVVVALKNKMDLAVGIALGSALQVALFVTPLLVFASYLRPQPIDLVFTTMEVVAVLLAAFVARMVAEDGESNWLEGVMLLMLYALLAIAFFFHPEPQNREGPAAPQAVPAQAGPAEPAP